MYDIAEECDDVCGFVPSDGRRRQRLRSRFYRYTARHFLDHMIPGDT